MTTEAERKRQEAKKARFEDPEYIDGLIKMILGPKA